MSFNSELALLKFINHYIKHNPDDNGQAYNEDQANLIETFSYSLVEKISPKTFEDSIIENKMKLKSPPTVPASNLIPDEADTDEVILDNNVL